MFDLAAIGITNFSAFLVAAILLNLTPGVDTFYVLGRSVTGGPRIGVASALGISGGLIVHTILAAFGLSLVLMSSAWLFWLIKVLGACYLIFLGIRTLVSKQTFAPKAKDGEEGSQSEGLAKAFGQGVITNVMNPKIALFFLAFLPQFIDVAASPGPLPFLVLGICFVVTSTIWSVILALGAGQFKRVLDNRPRVATYTNRATGILYILLGISIFATPLPE